MVASITAVFILYNVIPVLTYILISCGEPDACDSCVVTGSWPGTYAALLKAWQYTHVM